MLCLFKYADKLTYATFSLSDILGLFLGFFDLTGRLYNFCDCDWFPCCGQSTGDRYLKFALVLLPSFLQCYLAMVPVFIAFIHTYVHI
jgi:hypothetical protein